MVLTSLVGEIPTEVLQQVQALANSSPFNKIAFWQLRRLHSDFQRSENDVFSKVSDRIMSQTGHKMVES